MNTIAIIFYFFISIAVFFSTAIWTLVFYTGFHLRFIIKPYIFE